MRFVVLALGDKIEKFYLEAINEYMKRLNKYCNITLFHIKKQDQLQNKLKANSLVVVVSNNHNPISSEGLASKINNWAISGISEIVFVINANNTPHQDAITLTQMKMDFGLQTTVLMEQIYRAYRIINNHPYHK